MPSPPHTHPPHPRPLSPPGDDGIKHLFSRGAHFRFHFGPLLVMFAWYFLGAALAAGSAISSGLFVPMIMMGACLGRMVGLATTKVLSSRLAGAGAGRGVADPGWGRGLWF